MAMNTPANARYDELRDAFRAEKQRVTRHRRYRPPAPAPEAVAAAAVAPAGAPAQTRSWPSITDEALVRTVVVIACAATAFLLLVVATILLLSHFMDFWFALVATATTLAIFASVAAHRPDSPDGHATASTTRSLEDHAAVTRAQSHPHRWGMHVWH